jgi:hypothetical protein
MAAVKRNAIVQILLRPTSQEILSCSIATHYAAFPAATQMLRCLLIS